MRGRGSRVGHVGIAAGVLLIALLFTTTARAYEARPPGYVEGSEATPPGLPSPTSPSGATQVEASEAHNGAPRVETAPVLRYDRPAGRTVRINVVSGYCIGEPPPEIQRVEVHEHPIPGRTRIAAVITAFLRRPSPLEGAEAPPPDGEGPTEPVRVCDGLARGLYERITLGHRPDEMVLLDGSTSPARRIPGAAGSGSRRTAPLCPGADGRGPVSPCERPLSSTLFETGKVRIYAMPEEPEEHAEHRNPAISGRPVFACLAATGKSRLLDLPEVGGEKHAYWVKVDERVFAVNAPLVAYAYSEYYLDTHQTWVRVRNLLTGRVIRTCLVGGAIAPKPGPQVTDIVLSQSGEVGWNAQGESQPSSEEHEPGCNPTA